MTDLRALKYVPTGEIFYKLRFPEEFQMLDQRRNKSQAAIAFENIPGQYNERIKITKKKYSDLQLLKNSMPKDYQTFYDNLPHDD